MDPYRFAAPQHTQGHFQDTLPLNGRGDPPIVAAVTQHQCEQCRQRQGKQPLGQQVQRRRPAHVAAGAQYAGNGGDGVGVKRDGGKGRDCQCRGNGCRPAVQLEQRENIGLEHQRHQHQCQRRDGRSQHHCELQQAMAQGHDLLLALPLTDGLAHHNGGGGAQSEADHKEQPAQVPGNGIGRQEIHRNNGVTQNHRQHTVAKPPSHLVKEHRPGILDEPADHLPAGVAEGLYAQRQFFAAQGIDQTNGKLRDTGAQRGDGRAPDPQHGEAQLAVDQQIVQSCVQHRGKSEQLHAEIGILHAALDADIDGGKHIEHIGKADDLQIGRPQHRQLMLIAEQIHDCHRPQPQCHRQQQGKPRADKGCHADGPADALRIPFAPVLTGQDPKTALDAEYQRDQQKHRHVGGGYRCHGRVAQPADHKGVDEPQRKGNEILQGDGAGQSKKSGVKSAGTSQFLKHILPHSMEKRVFLCRSSASYSASMSAKVVSGPKLMRSTPPAVRLSRPSAVTTWLSLPR